MAVSRRPTRVGITLEQFCEIANIHQNTCKGFFIVRKGHRRLNIGSRRVKAKETMDRLFKEKGLRDRWRHVIQIIFFPNDTVSRGTAHA